VLGPVDHVGYLTDDLDSATAELTGLLGMPVARPVDLPQYSLTGFFIGEGSGYIELFTFTDPALLEQRLQRPGTVFDHAAHEVKDIDTVAAALAGRGVRFSGPDRREEVTEPILLGAVRHLWTIPQTCAGQSLQILQR
jgi:catechol 2,3-dioxygenase-like lactoylglutathione lyase family enzyme